jgi:hypothetical protein
MATFSEILRRYGDGGVTASSRRCAVMTMLPGPDRQARPTPKSKPATRPASAELARKRRTPGSGIAMYLRRTKRTYGPVLSACNSRRRRPKTPQMTSWPESPLARVTKPQLSAPSVPGMNTERAVRSRGYRKSHIMPMLKNIKWERFANAVAAGALQREAYKSAGFSSKYPEQAASKLANRPEVAARIKELVGRIEKRSTKAAVTKTAVTKEWVLRELVENLETHKGRNGPVVNRACELIGKELGMFRDDQPRKPLTLEDIPTEELERLLGSPAAPQEPEPAGDQIQ